MTIHYIYLLQKNFIKLRFYEVISMGNLKEFSY